MRKDDVYSTVHDLLNYEFDDGEKTECPIAVVGPDGTKQKKLRVYAYGGLIGRIATGDKGETTLADTGYAEYLKDCEADKRYLRNMYDKYVHLGNGDVEYSESTVCTKLHDRLQELLKGRRQQEDKDVNSIAQLRSGEYLDLILKAVEKKFIKMDGDLAERRIQTEIIRRHMKKEADAKWCVVDTEYTVPQKLAGKAFNPDIIVFDKKSGFGFIELKYMNASTYNLNEHYQNFQGVMKCGETEKMIDELTRRSEYLRNYDLISDAIYRSIKESKAQDLFLWQGFLFVGGEQEEIGKTIEDLKNQVGESIRDENHRFAFYPYDEQNGDDCIDKIELDYQSMQSYDEFIDRLERKK